MNYSIKTILPIQNTDILISNAKFSSCRKEVLFFILKMRRLEVFKNLEKSFRSIQIYEETVPIHLAVLNGQEELVQAAIDARVDVNLKCYISGETPLHLAVLFNYQNIFRQNNV